LSVMKSSATLGGLLTLAHAYENGAPNSKLPPLGWSSWVALGPGVEHPIFDYCDALSVKMAIDAFHEVGLYEAGYRHFHLDDCWAGGRNSTGFLFPEVDLFPDGLKPVVDYAHASNLTFGLYTCAGTQTCVGGRPGSKDHWTQDANAFAEWGVDWVKMDWCNTDGMEPKEAYANMSNAMNATGRSMHLNMCEWGRENPWEWGEPIAQSWRMSGDHTGRWASTKDLVRQSAKVPAQFSGRPWAWNDMDMLETGNYEQAAHANGKESNMTAVEYHTEFSMWAISASPLTVTTPIMNCTAHGPPPPVGTCRVALTKQHSQSACVLGGTFGCTDGEATMWVRDGCRGEFACDGIEHVVCDEVGVPNKTCVCAPPAPLQCRGWLSELQRDILLNTEVLAINQDVTPQGRPLRADDLAVWARALSDGAFAVALYNEDNQPKDLRVSFGALGAGFETAAVRDLWARKDLGVFGGGYPAEGGISVAAHETKLLKVTPQ